MPREYAVNSINPKGDKKSNARGGTSARSGVSETIEAKAYPVDHAENNPQATPNPGINMGNAIEVL